MVGRSFYSIFFRIVSVFIIFTFCRLSLGYGKTKVKANDAYGDSALVNAVPGKIIFVSGSCSSGKSSMAKILAEKLDAKSFAFDEYVMPLILKKFVTKHYGKFVAFFVSKFFMRNFFTSVDFLSEKQKYKFQMKFYNDLKQGMAIEPTKRMYREVKRFALQGKNVVVESPLFLWGGVDLLDCLNEFDGTNITYVLSYCPWNDLVDRIKQRNSSSNKKNHRELDWVLINYVYSLNISSDKHGDNFLEYLSGDDVHKTVAEYSQKQYKKKRLHLLTETQHAALQAFPGDSYYYIYPKFDYDITVNTKINNSQQGACAVLDYIQKRKTNS
jgi:deoxyadenosine/deoxycytidine kinase